MAYFIQKAEREIGPLEAENIIALLQDGTCSVRDLCRSEECIDWVPLGQLFPEDSWIKLPQKQTVLTPRDPLVAKIKSLLNEEQDEEPLKKIIPRIEEGLAQGESIELAAVQKDPIMAALPGILPETVVATNQRILYVKEKWFSLDCQDQSWRNLESADVKEEFLGATLRFRFKDGVTWQIEKLPKGPARRICEFARGILANRDVPPPLPTPVAGKEEDAAARLRKLKALLDGGLISEADYENKKKELLDAL